MCGSRRADRDRMAKKKAEQTAVHPDSGRNPPGFHPLKGRNRNGKRGRRSAASAAA